MQAKNLTGDIIEISSEILQTNLDQIEFWLDAASRFEVDGDFDSRDSYLNLAIRHENILNKVFE